MKIKLARESGFCYGVRRAVNLTFDEAFHSDNLYTLGELIHNPQVLEILKTRGVKVARSVFEIPDGASVIIRSHGVAPQIKQKLKARGFQIIDATCPKVSRVQQLAQRAGLKDHHVIIFGDKDHSEVKGISAYAGSKVSIIKSVKELSRALKKISEKQSITLLAQTTQNLAIWEDVKSRLCSLRRNVEVFETICGATDNRQHEVRQLASQVDAMVVVGGMQSGNTGRLAEIAEQEGVPAFHVESELDLPRKKLERFNTVGVAAGASTPSWMIRRIVYVLEGIGSKKNSLWTFLSGLWTFIVRSNILVAFGSAELLYASSRLQGIEPELHYQWIVAAYIFGMHLLNHFTDKFSTEVKYPARVNFYSRFRRLLLTVGLVAMASSLVVSYLLGPFTFTLIFAMSILGLIYRVELFGKRRFGAKRLMDIPGSKDVFLGMAWTIVIAILIVPASGSLFTPATAISALFVFSLVFTRSLVYSIRDLQGDRMVGRETIPVLLGESRTRRLGAVVLTITGILLIVSFLLEFTSPLSLFLIINLAYSLVLLWLTRSDSIQSDVLFESIVEGNLILSQLIAYGVYLVGLA